MSKTALLSVYDKTGIVEFAQELVQLDWDIYSSGGTAKVLDDAGVPVTDIQEIVGPAILDHRVATLSRELHGGLLADYIAHLEEMEQLGFRYIDLVCVDLYPLDVAISAADATRESVIKQTDIGGPTMMLAGAKGDRIVISDPVDRMRVIEWLKAGEPDHDEFINELGAKAYFTDSRYRLLSARYHSGGRYDGILGERVLTCKYGENAQQTPAAFFSSAKTDPLSLDQFDVVAGTDPSYNNLVEIGDRQVQTITHIAAGFERNFGDVPLIAIGGKHGNCCGAAVGDDPAEVIRQMLAGDLRAIHGGLVMTNFDITAELAEILLSWKIGGAKRRILDAISAPGFDDEAIRMLSRKGDKCRFLANPALSEVGEGLLDTAPRFRYVRGGFLLQPNYTFVLELPSEDLITPQPILRDLVLAWAIGSTSNSNTITLTRNGTLLGNGVGQQDRVGGAELAIKRACDANKLLGAEARVDGQELEGAAGYSDSFFPFPDGVQVLIEAGVGAILATSGSVNDDATLELCQKHGVRLIWLPDSVARGFAFH